MKRYVEMESPITGGRVIEVYEKERQDFRGESYEVHAHYYVCEDTGERFTTSDSPDRALDDLYAQYRNMHGIPFPEEIKGIRERYGLNYRQITTVLGFGENQYAQYEKGQVPSESNGKMIAAIADKDTMLKMLRSCKDEFTADEYSYIVSSVSNSTDAGSESTVLGVLYGRFRPSSLNGYTLFNESKASELVKMLAVEGCISFPSSMNKATFYADMLHFKRHGRAISGMRYKALQYGPTPYKFGTLYDNIDGLNEVEVIAHDNSATKFLCSSYDITVFSDDEVGVIREVASKIGGMSVKDIVDESHKEYAWIEHHELREFIPYTDSVVLNLFT